MRFGWVVLGLGVGGCGLGTQTGSCDFREGSLNGAEPRCQERVDTIEAETFKAACDASGGEPADGECSREGVVAGCMIGKQGDGSEVIDWYYAPKTVEEVESDCDDGELRQP
jgi:hypothetical protein